MQGSSNKYIIIGLDNTHRIKTLLSSNSIYTAATRAEIKCVIIAEPSAFRYGVHNTSENERQTFLPDFLK
jgi:ATP-dependent exoDNAse (exonuclease V) alpha subunit